MPFSNFLHECEANKAAIAERIVRELKDHPAILGWFITDENPVGDLAKARALGDAIVRETDDKGRLPTFWFDSWEMWPNCMIASARALSELAEFPISREPRTVWGNDSARSHYFIRRGEHNIRESNWLDYLDFTKSHGW